MLEWIKRVAKPHRRHRRLGRFDLFVERLMGEPGRNVTPLRRLCYAAQDFAGYAAPIFVILIFSGIHNSGIFRPMQRYSNQNYIDYVGAVTLAMIVMLIISIALHRFRQASIGKAALNCITVRADGGRLGWLDCLRRGLFCWFVGLCIVAPGPLAAFLLGSNSEL